MRSRLNFLPNSLLFPPEIFWCPGLVLWALFFRYLTCLPCLRSRLNAISLGLPASSAGAGSLPASRTPSIDDENLRRTGSTSTSAAERKVSGTQPPPHPGHHHQLLQPPASRQFLSVDTGQRLSESSSAPSSASSSRGGSWVYLTR